MYRTDMLMADEFWGERSRLAYALKTQLDYGARQHWGRMRQSDPQSLRLAWRNGHPPPRRRLAICEGLVPG